MRDKPDLDAIQKALNNLPESDERWKTILEAGKIYEVICKAKQIYMEITGISDRRQGNCRVNGDKKQFS